MKPELSVIIPTYKRTDSLEKVLDCLYKQENILLEIIVVDQNEAGYITNFLGAKLQGANHIIQDSPNASLARNNGFKNSTCNYILFLDDDLQPEPDFCKNALDIFQAYPLIKSYVPLVYSQDGKKTAMADVKNKQINFYPYNKTIFSITDALSAAVFFERSYFKLSGGFDVHLFEFAKSSEDMELFLRMKNRGMTLWFVPFLQIFHDETVIGGCDLRNDNYWSSRRKNVRALVFRNRIHSHHPEKLSLGRILKVSRSSFINKQVLKSGVSNILKEIKLLVRSIKASKEFYLKHKNIYRNSSSNFIDD